MDEIWQQVTGVQPTPPLALVVLMGLLAAACVMWRPMWRWSRHAVTIAHEGAHAVVALMVGRSLHGVRLHRDTSGLTVSRGAARGPGAIATLLAGYPGPALVGLGGAWVLGTGHATLLLWLLLIVLAGLLLQIRNGFGLLLLIAAGALVFAVTRYLPGEGQSTFAHFLVWFLLFAAPFAVVDLWRARRTGQAAGSDADQLAHLTRLPAGLWVAVFGIVTFTCTIAGTALLLARLR